MADEIIIPQEIRKINIIKKLKEYKDQNKIIPFLQEYNKKQESDYFMTPNNIKIGRINPIKQKFYDKNNNLIPYSFVGPPHIFNSSNNNKRFSVIRQNSMMKNKYNNSLSTSRFEKSKNKESLKINKNHTIDNKSLKNYYNEIRQRIAEDKKKNEDRYKLLIQVPFGIRKSLINQENIFSKIMREKRLKKIMQEKIIKKCNKESISDLLINKSIKFDEKYQKYSIIEKNITCDNKYRDNLWNITLRNPKINGKYEKVGYINIGDNFRPTYTFFNLNQNIEYFNNPRYERNKTEEKKNNKLYSDLNENKYNLKVKNNLNLLNSLENLEIKGKNLLNIEDNRESEIKGKKIFYNKHDLDILEMKQKDKSRNDREFNIMARFTLDDIYEDKTFAKNYKKNDFYKNANLTSKYSNNIYNLIKDKI